MARNFAQVKVSIWDGADFTGLSADAQRLYFVLMTRVETSLAGVIDWHPGRLAQLACDTTPEAIEKAAAELESARFIIIDRTTEECLLRTMVRHDETLHRGPKIAAGVVSAWRAVYSRHLKSAIADEAVRSNCSNSVQEVLQPMIEWHIECPIECVNDMSKDAQSDTQSDGVSRQPATSNQQPATSSATALFDTFWRIYPRRIAKKSAEKAWSKAAKATDPELIIAGARRYADQTKATDPKFVKHPATWLNGGCWEDEDTPTEGPRVMVRNGVQQEVTW